MSLKNEEMLESESPRPIGPKPDVLLRRAILIVLSGPIYCSPPNRFAQVKVCWTGEFFEAFNTATKTPTVEKQVRN